MRDTLDGQEISGPLNPLHNVILVKIKDAADISAGGIVLPDQVRGLPLAIFRHDTATYPSASCHSATFVACATEHGLITRLCVWHRQRRSRLRVL